MRRIIIEKQSYNNGGLHPAWQAQSRHYFFFTAKCTLVKIQVVFPQCYNQKVRPRNGPWQPLAGGADLSLHWSSTLGTKGHSDAPAVILYAAFHRCNKRLRSSLCRFFFSPAAAAALTVAVCSRHAMTCFTIISMLWTLLPRQGDAVICPKVETKDIQPALISHVFPLLLLLFLCFYPSFSLWFI